MADYRQSCGNPTCSYTGFTGHSAGCYVVQESREREKEQQARKALEETLWNNFFGNMTDEELFTYAKLCDDEIQRVYKFKRRYDKALEYMRRKDKARKFLDWRRNG